MKKVVEICAGSYQDCLAAQKMGASRVELNSALSVGGLTPSVAVLRRVKKETQLHVICMVRPRGGGFCYDEQDVSIMMDEAKLLLENGADGIAFGFLKDDGSIAIEETKAMVALIHSYKKEAVFHRAFDVCKDPFIAIQTLIDLHVDRLLTSGMKDKAVQGKELLKQLQLQFKDKIEILAGSGMNAQNALSFMEETGICQIHSSCKGYKEDPTTSKGDVTYSYLPSPHQNDYDIVEEEKVHQLVYNVEKG